MEGFSATIAEAYGVGGEALDLGRGVHEGTLHPDAAVRLPLRAANRHGLVAGATGTGKTRTLQVLAEGALGGRASRSSRPTTRATSRASSHRRRERAERRSA